MEAKAKAPRARMHSGIAASKKISRGIFKARFMSSSGSTRPCVRQWFSHSMFATQPPSNLVARARNAFPVTSAFSDASPWASQMTPFPSRASLATSWSRPFTDLFQWICFSKPICVKFSPVLMGHGAFSPVKVTQTTSRPSGLSFSAQAKSLWWTFAFSNNLASSFSAAFNFFWACSLKNASSNNFRFKEAFSCNFLRNVACASDKRCLASFAVCFSNFSSFSAGTASLCNPASSRARARRKAAKPEVGLFFMCLRGSLVLEVLFWPPNIAR